MKVTLKDMNEVMDGLRGGERNLPPELIKQVTDLNGMLTSAEGFNEICRQIALAASLHCIKLERNDFDDILNAAVQMAIMAGATIGFRLGLCEAGLALGIPQAPTFKTKS